MMMMVISRSNTSNTTWARDWTEVYEVVQWIQLVMALLSIGGSSSIIVCLIKQRLCQKPELQPLIQLSVADLLLAVCWLIGAVLFSTHCSNLLTLCYNLHTAEQIFYMASFFCTLNYVWTLHTGIKEKFNSCLSENTVQFSNRVKTGAKLISVFSCLVPALLMMPVFVLGNISQCQANFSKPYRCLLMHTGALYLTSDHHLSTRCNALSSYQMAAFLLTFFITLTGVIALMMNARIIYRRVVTAHGYLGNEQRASFRALDQRMVLYPLVFVLCWGPAVVLSSLHLLKLLAGHGLVEVILYITQAFTSASQGFFNCLVYGWTCVHLRRAGFAAASRDVNTQTPLLRCQQNRSYQSLRTVV